MISYVNETLLCSYACPVDPSGALGCWDNATYEPDPQGKYFVPFETTVSIQNPGDAWFWHSGHAFLSAAELFDQYLATVGRGAHWILNLPPNTTGIIPQAYVESVTTAGDAIRRSFGVSVGSSSHTTKLTGQCEQLAVVVRASAVFDAVMIREDLSAGQAILSYSLELQDCHSGSWELVRLNSTLAGQTVGMKSIAVLRAPSSACAVRLRCTAAIGGPQSWVRLLGMSLHKVHYPPAAESN